MGVRVWWYEGMVLRFSVNFSDCVEYEATSLVDQSKLVNSSTLYPSLTYLATTVPRPVRALAAPLAIVYPSI